MRQITDYKEVSPLILGYFKRGVITNNFLTPDDYKAEIAESRLFAGQTEDMLTLYLKRNDFYIMYFYTFSKTAVLPQCTFPVVCEAISDGAEFLKNNGFCSYTTRVRLERAENVCTSVADYAEKKDAEEIYRLMEKAFDKYSGYIPTLSLIRSECENSGIIKIEKNNQLAGFLRFSKNGKKLQIKHLCINENYRGMGLGKLLCNSLPQAKCSVWTGEDNIPALNLYKSAGFAMTNDRSEVYLKG